MGQTVTAPTRPDIPRIRERLASFTPEVQAPGRHAPWFLKDSSGNYRFCAGGWLAQGIEDQTNKEIFCEIPLILEDHYGLVIGYRAALYDASDLAENPEDRTARLSALLDRWEAEQATEVSNV